MITLTILDIQRPNTVEPRLIGHPSTVDTHNITDNSESPDYFSLDFITFKPPLNSGHPATPYN